MQLGKQTRGRAVSFGADCFTGPLGSAWRP